MAVIVLPSLGQPILHRPGARGCEADRNLHLGVDVEVWSTCFNGTPGGDGWIFFSVEDVWGVEGWLGLVGFAWEVSRFYYGVFGGAREETH